MKLSSPSRSRVVAFVLLVAGGCATGVGNEHDAAPDRSGAICGDGVVDSFLETCDTAITSGTGACPTECIDDDGEACSIERLVGTGCTATCQPDLAGCV